MAGAGGLAEEGGRDGSLMRVAYRYVSSRVNFDHVEQRSRRDISSFVLAVYDYKTNTIYIPLRVTRIWRALRDGYN